MGLVSNPIKVSFGSFEAGLSMGKLWRGGFRIKILGQPFRDLAEVIQRPGQVVTREEKGSNVDFDHSLGRAVNKIREALRGDVDNPRFVETLTRRGYKFIAPVTVLETRASTPVAHVLRAPRRPLRNFQDGAVGRRACLMRANLFPL